MGCACIPCNEDEIFDGIECRRPWEMQIYKGLQGFEIEGADFIRIGPIEEEAVSRVRGVNMIMYYRSGVASQDPCTCTHDRDFAHLCGYSVFLEQNAYLKTETDYTLLSSFDHETDAIDADRRGVVSFKIERKGVCQNCKRCENGQFNSECPTNKYEEGRCMACKIIGEDCQSRQYLSHTHPLGCAFDSAGSDYTCSDCETYVKNSLGFFLLVGCGVTNFVRWPHAHHLASSASALVAETCAFEAGAPECVWGGVQLERKVPFGSHSLEIPYCPPGYYFACRDGDVPLTSAVYSVACCARCRDCDVASGLKRGASYKNCTGYTDSDTQYTHCQARCENNMYENADGECVECTTCREGEI